MEIKKESAQPKKTTTRKATTRKTATHRKKAEKENQELQKELEGKKEELQEQLEKENQQLQKSLEGKNEELQEQLEAKNKELKEKINQLQEKIDKINNSLTKIKIMNEEVVIQYKGESYKLAFNTNIYRVIQQAYPSYDEWLELCYPLAFIKKLDENQINQRRFECTNLFNFLEDDGKIQKGYESKVNEMINNLSENYNLEIKVVDGAIDDRDYKILKEIRDTGETSFKEPIRVPDYESIIYGLMTMLNEGIDIYNEDHPESQREYFSLEQAGRVFSHIEDAQYATYITIQQNSYQDPSLKNV